MARLRFRLSADPNQLAGFDSDAGAERRGRGYAGPGTTWS